MPYLVRFLGSFTPDHKLEKSSNSLSTGGYAKFVFLEGETMVVGCVYDDRLRSLFNRRASFKLAPVLLKKEGDSSQMTLSDVAKTADGEVAPLESRSTETKHSSVGTSDGLPEDPADVPSMPEDGSVYDTSGGNEPATERDPDASSSEDGPCDTGDSGSDSGETKDDDEDPDKMSIAGFSRMADQMDLETVSELLVQDGFSGVSDSFCEYVVNSFDCFSVTHYFSGLKRGYSRVLGITLPCQCFASHVVIDDKNRLHCPSCGFTISYDFVKAVKTVKF